MKKKLAHRVVVAALSCCSLVAAAAGATQPSVIVDTSNEPVAAGPFQPSWDSLAKYQTPDWFRDAKFGIWAHWGPQCEPEAGDWYARSMYQEGSGPYKDHLARWGPPSKTGFKDVIHDWKAENFDPAELLALYKRAGAQYFFALANHHDNFDNYDSKYQPWNSVNMGPKKDLIAMWAKATHDQGLKFGVSVHAAHAWSWYEVAQGADKKGEFAGVPYDGKLTKADGKGLWWDGYDPQDLYAQNHVPGKKLEWDWNAAKGSSTPDQAYCDKFFNRTMDLINKYNPDLIYFDDSQLPLWPVSDAGLKIAAHFYNRSAAANSGAAQTVVFGKILNAPQRKCLVWDIERGQSQHIEPLPWQTDTCIGSWHYDKAILAKHRYKSAATVIRTLVDVVSKNGNLLLSVPVKADGTIDSDERKIVEGIAAWMDVNRESIFGTRPWKVFGEGPQADSPPPISAQGFNEGKTKPATNADVRYTAKGDSTIYAFVLSKPAKEVKLVNLGKAAGRLDRAIASVEQLGAGAVEFKQADETLDITPKLDGLAADQTVVYKITLAVP
ncbi:alpha-L-fucosidase [soil metagenome]